MREKEKSYITSTHVVHPPLPLLLPSTSLFPLFFSAATTDKCGSAEEEASRSGDAAQFSCKIQRRLQSKNALVSPSVHWLLTS